MRTFNQKVVLIFILLVGMILINPISAQTSENLEWSVEVGDQSLFQWYYWTEGQPIYQEDVIFNVSVAMDPLPDPLNNWEDIPDIMVNTMYTNGTETNLLDFLQFMTWKNALPTGNWSLMTELVESVFEYSWPFENFTVEPQVNIDDTNRWGFTYEITVQRIDYIVSASYLKSDGFLATSIVLGYVESTTYLTGEIRIQRDGYDHTINRPGNFVSENWILIFGVGLGAAVLVLIIVWYKKS